MMHDGLVWHANIYVYVPQLKCQQSGYALVLRFQLRDIYINMLHSPSCVFWTLSHSRTIKATKFRQWMEEVTDEVGGRVIKASKSSDRFTSCPCVCHSQWTQLIFQVINHTQPCITVTQSDADSRASRTHMLKWRRCRQTEYHLQLTDQLPAVECVQQIDVTGRTIQNYNESHTNRHKSVSLQVTPLTLSPRKAEKPASPTVTNSRKAEIPACRSLIYSHKDEISAWKFREKNCYK